MLKTFPFMDVALLKSGLGKKNQPEFYREIHIVDETGVMLISVKLNHLK